MKKLFLFIYIMIIGSAVMAEDVRIYFKPDGKISVMYKITNWDDPDYLSGIDYVVNSSTTLPETDRTKWRWNLEDYEVYIDTTVITIGEQITALQEDLDYELEQSTPNAVEIIRIQREIEILRESN